MSMLFNHVMIGTNDVERSRRFYDAVMAPLGLTNAASSDSLLMYRRGHEGFASLDRHVIVRSSSEVNRDGGQPAHGGRAADRARPGLPPPGRRPPRRRESDDLDGIK